MAILRLEYLLSNANFDFQVVKIEPAEHGFGSVGFRGEASGWQSDTTWQGGEYNCWR